MTESNNIIKLVAGLGNPGASYQNNRHNIGFIALDEIAKGLDLASWRQGFSGQWTETVFQKKKILLLKPQTYMNLSGKSVAACANFYKIKPEEILVIYDELDLAPGRIKIKQNGGNGGHNGIRSIEEHLGKNFHRMRIGIGHPGSKEQVSGYVLSNFSAAEAQFNEKLLTEVGLNFTHLLTGKFDLFMNNIAVTTKL